MAQVPAHVKCVRGSSCRISSHKDELVKVQKLYFAHRYKACASLCQQLQRPEAERALRDTDISADGAQIHPLHRAFLYFYQAISFEAMGQIAHDFSRSKPQLLDSAQESFKAALDCLPLPYASTEYASFNHLETTPSVVFDSPFSSNSLSPYVSPNQRDVENSPPQSKSICGLTYSIPPLLPSASTHCLSTSLQLDPHFQEENKKQIDSAQDYIAPPKSPTGHKGRLCQSLSLTHSLQDDLVPSPLFNRTQKRAQIYSSWPDLSHRPLPPLPFGHKTSFAVEGSRVVQVPRMGMRKTAVQSLIAKYEETAPVTLTPSLRRSSQSSTSIHSLVTPRFKRIRDAFSPDPRNDSLEAYLSSTDLTRYNICMAEFRTQVRKHVAFLEVEITRVRNQQAQRMARKAQNKNRHISFWTFQPANRLVLPPTPSDTKNNTTSDDPVTTAKKERIERLRKEGWDVRKEKYGFKSVEWYEAFRCRVEKEMAAYEMVRG